VLIGWICSDIGRILYCNPLSTLLGCLESSSNQIPMTDWWLPTKHGNYILFCIFILSAPESLKKNKNKNKKIKDMPQKATLDFSFYFYL
jgi:hypothetical protein